jgi:hypothetical protein
MLLLYYYLEKSAGKPGMRRTYFRLGPLPDRASSSHVTDVTSGQKVPLGRMWRNFRLRMRIAYFRILTDVTSGHVTHITSGHVTHVTSGHVTHVTSGHVTHVTSGHVTHVTSGHVTHVTSGHAQWSDPPQM